MYDYLDRPVTSLDHGGRFLIWSTRSWVKAMAEKVCPASVIAPAFSRWNMLGGLQPFLRMMILFNRHGLENFQFCALQCNHVSEHEALIIILVRGSRETSPYQFRETLGLVVEDEAVADLILMLSRFSRAMDAAGICPRPPVGSSPSQSSGAC